MGVESHQEFNETKEVLSPEELNEFRRRAYEGSWMTDRSFEQYEVRLGLPTEELINKTILDIGSGQRETFAREATEKGINVISLNPNLAPGSEWTKYIDPLRYEKIQEAKRDRVRGIAQELPFRDSSFDAVVSYAGVPTWLPDDIHEARRTVHEIARVLKPGGKAYLYPGRVKESFNVAVDELEKEGFKVTLGPMTQFVIERSIPKNEKTE